MVVVTVLPVPPYPRAAAGNGHTLVEVAAIGVRRWVCTTCRCRVCCNSAHTEWGPAARVRCEGVAS